MSKMKYKIENNIARITIDDGKANAMNPEFFKELNDAMDLSLNDDAGVLIIQGRTDFFSAGLDLKYVSNAPIDERKNFLRQFGYTLLKVFSLPIPTIAACTGHAIAGGAMLAFACDLIYGIDAPQYRVHMNEVAAGIAPIPSWMLLIGNSCISKQYQTEFLLHSKLYSPKEACEKEIFNDVFSNADDMISHTNKKAEELLGLSRKAYAISKDRMWRKGIKEAMDRSERDLEDAILFITE